MKLKEWYDVNPRGFFMVRNPDGRERMGQLIMLPLLRESLEAFMLGKVRERDLRGADLYPASRRLISAIYIESLILVEPHPFKRARCVRYILSRLTSLLETLASSDNLESIYATAATDDGRRLLVHLGFRLVVPASQRLDRHDFYGLGFRELGQSVERLVGAADAADLLPPTYAHRFTAG
ncbi:MAG TPA: hypothetical protein VHQ90_14835 [Thermoanaerobaculia bacterium]|nr:hypothetical protein [Thermoanaerobaculia bacterium]